MDCHFKFVVFTPVCKRNCCCFLNCWYFYIAPTPDTYIQKTKKSYIDSRARRNLGSINTELQDVQRIMVANIEEVLQRGEALSGKSVISGIFGSDYKSLNTMLIGF